MKPIVTVTHAPEETLDVAARVGDLLRAGDVVALSGDLGAGKTVFAKGIAHSLGVDEPVVSPTFTVVREYDARIPLVHIDVYRLDHVQELHDIGWDELLDGAAVAVVEWGDRVRALLPIDRLEVRIDMGAGDDDRVLTFDPSGAAWAARAEALAGVVGDGER